jgi:hypothetical protein
MGRNPAQEGLEKVPKPAKNLQRAAKPEKTHAFLPSFLLSPAKMNENILVIPCRKASSD